jgi:4-amino-4-deoxy-L-arabinose transferase-like glycosyltransferase
MQGIFHAYYAVALAPAVGALVGMGATGLWEVRRNLVTRWWLAGTVGVTAVWSWVLLRRTPDWHPELAPLMLLGGLAVAALIAAVPWQGPAGTGWAGQGGGPGGGPRGGGFRNDGGPRRASVATAGVAAWAGPPSTTSRPDDAHHQPWRFAQRSSVPEMVAITSRTAARWRKSVRSLAMMFIP